MSCKLYDRAESRLLAFLYTKKAIDATRKVTNQRLAEFYQPILSKNLGGLAYEIKDGVVEPNARLLAKFDRTPPPYEATNYQLPEPVLPKDLQVDDPYLKDFVERGLISLDC